MFRYRLLVFTLFTYFLSFTGIGIVGARGHYSSSVSIFSLVAVETLGEVDLILYIFVTYFSIRVCIIFISAAALLHSLAPCSGIALCLCIFIFQGHYYYLALFVHYTIVSLLCCIAGIIHSFRCSYVYSCIALFACCIVVPLTVTSVFFCCYF